MKLKIIFLFILVSVLISCSNNPKQADTVTANSTEDNVVALTANQAKNVIIETCTISTAQIPLIQKVNGSIDVPPQNLVSVSCPSGGYLTQTKLLPGMIVKKGEVIATITDQQFIQLQQDYLATKSKIHFAEIEFDRQKVLAANEATSDKALQFTNAELQQNRIILSSLAEKLKLISINPLNVSTSNIKKSIALYAPISGFVNKVNVNIGKYVSPSDVLFEIINPTDIHLNLKVFDNVAQDLKIRQKVNAYSNNDLSNKHDCEIILINKEVDANGVVEVHCHFENYDPKLIVGMYMNAEIETQSNLQNTLPMDCVVSFEGKTYVFALVKKDTYEMLEVQTGVEDGNFIEIKNASLLQNKSLVKKGAYTLLMTLKNIAE